MSTQRGNTSRTRPQKYKNSRVFKNNLHDTSHTTKLVNSLQITNVCTKCKSIIEWKIKYKKYKPLKAPATCVKCHEKCVKHSYHTWCIPCASKALVCPKCGQKDDTINNENLKEEKLTWNDLKEQAIGLSERKKRTLFRYSRKLISADDEEANKTIPKKIELLILDKLSELTVGDNNSDDFGLSDDDEEDGSGNSDY